LRSGAVAVAEPEEPDEADYLQPTPVKVGAIKGDPIVEAIQAAFADTEPPGSDAWGWCISSEWPEQSEYIRRRVWQDLELEKMAELVADRKQLPFLMCLSPDALRYYLPAFLIVAVALPTIPGTRDLIRVLSPPGRGDPNRGAFRYFVGGLSLEQKDVIGRCLQRLRVDIDGAFFWWKL
jgi:hypothetical protein